MRRKWLIIGSIVLTLVIILAGIKGIVGRHTGKNWNMPLAGRVIVVDAGHGGIDGGAVGGDAIEKKITLKIARDLRDYLQETGAIVIMTRDSDDDLSDDDYIGRHKTQDLLRRADIIKKNHPDAFISIHLNAIPNSRWRGAQTFFYPNSGKNERLAMLIQDSIQKNLSNTNRQAKAIGFVYLLKKASPPAALVEVGFLSNPTERSLLVQRNYQRSAAASISQGIMRYFTKEEVKTSK
ncbi:N-acetylmuramoyl-L-alanine amidase CwlD [Sporolactobacillus spathodeae]|uniref:N-acetylmuramoyl-L-alanine amidase n=1 Tax=Sporolactobacillus spathodeae TaxID=1465502 RepID=A0ABS2Q9Z0_9BACL|nr:N-acetylmuramoyl-L-alanine amidase CwlD [Sporolactobacillus spathodeae]MBM7658609.1 N-acetylmuramoyl-L-alanine amidase [Sporolactobacillus spathodeae]